MSRGRDPQVLIQSSYWHIFTGRVRKTSSLQWLIAVNAPEEIVSTDVKQVTNKDEYVKWRESCPLLIIGISCNRQTESGSDIFLGHALFFP